MRKKRDLEFVVYKPHHVEKNSWNGVEKYTMEKENERRDSHSKIKTEDKTGEQSKKNQKIHMTWSIFLRPLRMLNQDFLPENSLITPQIIDSERNTNQLLRAMVTRSKKQTQT